MQRSQLRSTTSEAGNHITASTITGTRLSKPDRLKEFQEAKRILTFDHTVRPSGGSRPPVLPTHIDQSKTAAMERVRALLPYEADDLLQDRIRIVNVWRPLNGPVQSFPLAFADSTTVKDEDFHVVEHRYADRTGETLSWPMRTSSDSTGQG